ncbi:MAG: chromate efflux transporter [candidate division Zixibacteria bacterium]|nr:chromate efflux transporter [candidate division Zixibacteria bacterium]
MNKQIAFLFLKLGFIAFGGPAAHIAMMEDEVVTKRKWMSQQHFLDLVGATNLIPGPNSTEMAIHCGFHRGGIPGLLVAGASFIFPAVLLTGALAYLYVNYGTVPEVEPFLFGIKPAVIIIILNAVYKLGKKAVKGWLLAVIGAGVLAVSLLGLNAIYSILSGGIVGMIILYSRDRFQASPMALISPFLIKMKSQSPFLIPISVTATDSSVPLMKLFLIFLKVGAILFGSGYVLVAYLDAELVQSLGWLTANELIDAIAIGQFTPGPVLSTSTFIGYQINGIPGAIVATLGIFLPSFFFVAILNPLIPKLRQSKLASAFLDAVNVSAVAIMITATIHLGQEVMLDWRSWVIAALSAIVVFSFKKLNSAYIVLGGAVIGYLLYTIG